MNVGSEEIIEYFNKEKYMPLLPLLESQLNDIKKTHKEINEKQLRKLVNYALNWETYDYWQGKAVSWLEEGLMLDSEIESNLHKLSLNKNVSQSLRHKMFKLLK